MDIKKMTDEELDKAIAQKYGDDWELQAVDENDDLIKEFIRRLEMVE